MKQIYSVHKKQIISIYISYALEKKKKMLFTYVKGEGKPDYITTISLMIIISELKACPPLCAGDGKFLSINDGDCCLQVLNSDTFYLKTKDTKCASLLVWFPKTNPS